MAQQEFVSFFSNYLPQHPELKKSIETIEDPRALTVALMEAGRKAGFAFSEVDVAQVLQASLRAELAGKGELTSEELEAVAGGVLSTATVPTIQISSLSSAKNATLGSSTGVRESTWMCTY